jgi:hypothetical protein
MKKTTKTIALAAVFTLIATAVPLAVFAETGKSTAPTTGSSGSSSSTKSETETHSSSEPQSTTTAAQAEKDREVKLEQAREQTKTQLEEAKKNVKQKLETKRLETCTQRTARINTLLKDNATRSQGTLTKFASVLQRVEDYKTAHNLTVANYDGLVADVKAKEAAAASAIGTVSGTTFDCTSQDANAVGKFQTGVIKDELNAIKAYRTAIKNLITAVKQAADAAAKTSGSN